MHRIAFDFDNTLVDCLPSDYAVYLATCSVLDLVGVDLDRYERLRRGGQFNQILRETHVENVHVFQKTRRELSLDENFCLNDVPILETQLLDLVCRNGPLVIISARDSKAILDKQIQLLGWEDYFEWYCVPRGTEEAVAEAKKIRLQEEGATHFVGDKLSDIRAAKAACAVPVLVKTGFWHVTDEGAMVMRDVNDFLRYLHGETALT